MNVGMLGAGTIATWLSDTFVKMGGSVTTYAIASAFPEECPKFVEKYGWKKWYPTYDEVVMDPEVDIVYIAVPNPFHYELCKLALENNKPVICEKPFCLNESQTREVIELARSKGLFITEALWSNYLPSRFLIDEVIESGIIGEMQHADIVIKNDVSFLNRIKSPELAGGAILDIGCYTFARMTTHFGDDIESIDAKMTFFDTGVDDGEEIDIKYANGLAVKIVNKVNEKDEFEDSTFYGTKGKMVINNTANPKAIRVYDLEDRLIRDVEIPEYITGYEFEFLACARALENGEVECAEIPHKQMLAIAHLTDEVRRIGGLKYPCE